MNKNMDAVIVSDWYELVKGTDLKQGDIIENCPFFLPPREMEWPIDFQEIQGFDCGYEDSIIMSQSCDLEGTQKSDMWLVLLCPIWELSMASSANSFLGSSFGKEECRRGHMTGYHMINGCDHEEWRRDIAIVSFREVRSLPLNFVHKIINNKHWRPRLRSPYREHLAQAFARYFMRVGLPVDIPRFGSAKAEAEVMKRLRALDNNTRKKVFSCFRLS